MRKKDNVLASMPSGKYYIGDLCYVMHDRWDEFCQKSFDEDGYSRQGRIVMDDGSIVAWFGTAWGDGTYRDQSGRKYGVDAGLIGCIKMNDINHDNLENEVKFGHIVNFVRNFECGYQDGDIWFDDITINTDPSYEEEEEYED